MTSRRALLGGMVAATLGWLGLRSKGQAAKPDDRRDGRVPAPAKVMVIGEMTDIGVVATPAHLANIDSLKVDDIVSVPFVVRRGSGPNEALLIPCGGSCIDLEDGSRRDVELLVTVVPAEFGEKAGITHQLMLRVKGIRCSPSIVLRDAALP